MENSLKTSAFYKEMEGLLAPSGVSLIEARCIQTRSGNVVSLYVTKEGDLTTETLEEVYNLVYLHLKNKFSSLTLEVSTPGCTRNIKDAGEFAYFINRSVRLYIESLSSWVSCTIKEARETSLIVTNALVEDTNEQFPEKEFKYSDIKKARLIDSFLKDKESKTK